MSNINLHNVSKEEQALVRSYNDLIYFGKLFDPGNFMRSETPFFHQEIANEFLSNSTKPLAIIIARGHAKTTMNKIHVLYRLIWAKKAYEWGFCDKERFEFIAWVADSQRKSQNNVAYVKRHLERNDKLKYYFGSLKSDVKWTQEDLVLANESRLLSRSNLTSIRGETQSTESGEQRYSFVIPDDVESEENTKTENARENLRNVIMNGAFPAIDINYGRMIWVGTPIHYEAFTQKILDGWNKAVYEGKQNDYTWKVITYGAEQPNMPGGVLWNSFVPKTKLMEIKSRYASSPQGISGYYQEYLLQVASSANSFWNRSHIHYWKGYYLRENGLNFIVKEGEKYPVNIFIGIDPATSIEGFDTDHSVITVIAVDKDNNTYILEYIGKRSIPSKGIRGDDGNILDGQKKGVVDYIWDMIDKYHPNLVTCEKVAMNQAIFDDFYHECKRRNNFKFGLSEYEPKGRKKGDRIYAVMNSRFASKSIFLQEGMPELEEQIIKFGNRMGHDDFIDSLHIACAFASPSTIQYDAEKKQYKKYKPKVRYWTTA